MYSKFHIKISKIQLLPSWSMDITKKFTCSKQQSDKKSKKRLLQQRIWQLKKLRNSLGSKLRYSTNNLNFSNRLSRNFLLHQKQSNSSRSSLAIFSMIISSRNFKLKKKIKWRSWANLNSLLITKSCFFCKKLSRLCLLSWCRLVEEWKVIIEGFLKIPPWDFFLVSLSLCMHWYNQLKILH